MKTKSHKEMKVSVLYDLISKLTWLRYPIDKELRDNSEALQRLEGKRIELRKFFRQSQYCKELFEGPLQKVSEAVESIHDKNFQLKRKRAKIDEIIRGLTKEIKKYG